MCLVAVIGYPFSEMAAVLSEHDFYAISLMAEVHKGRNSPNRLTGKLCPGFSSSLAHKCTRTLSGEILLDRREVCWFVQPTIKRQGIHPDLKGPKERTVSWGEAVITLG